MQLAGRIWVDYAGILIAADEPAGGATDPAFAQAVTLIGSIEIVAHSDVPQKPTTKAISK